MNKIASSHKIASIHLARMERRAAFMGGLKSKILSAVIEKEARESSSQNSRASKEGLKFLTSSLGYSSLDSFLKKPIVDLSDPIQKMLSYSLGKASNKAEAREMIGLFSVAFKNKDVEGMASALRLEREVVAVVLLWYIRGGKSASRSRGYQEFSETTEIQTRGLFSMSEKALGLLERLIDGGVGFLLSIFPQPVQNVARQPLKWAAMYATLLKSWWLIGTAGSIVSKIFAVGWVALAGFTPMVASLISLGITGSAVFFAIEAYIWIGETAKSLKEWSSDNTLDAVSVPFKIVWELFRSILEGTYKVSRWVFRELKSYVRLFKGEVEQGHLSMEHLSGGRVSDDEVFEGLLLNV